MANIFQDTALFEMFRNVKRLHEGRLFVSVISRNEVKNLIVDLNVEQMQLNFMDSNGRQLSSIAGDYSPFTVEAGGKKNAQSVDLHDTGYFHDSFEVVKITQKNFSINSDPRKDDGTNLLEVWGEDIEGLTFENLEKLGQYLIPKYIEEIKKQYAAL